MRWSAERNTRIMSSIATSCWKRILSSYTNVRPYRITQTRSLHKDSTYEAESRREGETRRLAQMYGPRGGEGSGASSWRLVKPDFIPVYTLVGMCVLCFALGIINMKQELLHNPSVTVDKKKRKTIPEIKDPDYVVHKADDYINKSFFRRIGQNIKRETDLAQSMPWILDRRTRKHVETLQSVGVEPADL